MGASRKADAPDPTACSSLDLVGAVTVGVGAVASRVGSIFAFCTNCISRSVGILDDVFGDCVGILFNRVSRILGVRFDVVGNFFLSGVIAGSERTKTDGDGQRG